MPPVRFMQGEEVNQVTAVCLEVNPVPVFWIVSRDFFTAFLEDVCIL